MLRLHLTSSESPEVDLLLSAADLPISIGRSDAGNAIVVDCEQDIFCRLIWESGAFVFRANGTARFLHGDSADLTEWRVNEAFQLTLSGREISGELLVCEEGVEEKELRNRSPRIHQEPLVTAATDDVVSLQVFFNEPLIRVGLIAEDTTAIPLFLDAFASCTLGDDFHSSVERLRQLPHPKKRRPHASEREAAREFKSANEPLSKNKCELARYIFRLSRKGEPSRLIEVVTKEASGQNPSQSSAHTEQRMRSFLLHAQAWVLLVEKGVKDASQIREIFLSLGLEKPTGCPLAICSTKLSPTTEELSAWITYFETTTPGRPLHTFDLSGGQAEEVVNVWRWCADAGCEDLYGKALHKVCKSIWPVACWWGSRAKDLKQKRSQVSPSTTALHSGVLDLRKIQVLYQLRRSFELGLLIMILIGVGFSVNSLWQSTQPTENSISPNLRSELTLLEQVLNQGDWNQALQDMDLTIDKWAHKYTELAEYKRKALSLWEEAFLALRKDAYDQISQPYLSESNDYLNVVDALYERSEPFHSFAENEQIQFKRFAADAIRYRKLQSNWQKWEKAELTGEMLLQSLTHYLESPDAVMHDVVTEVLLWLEAPRNVYVKVRKVTWNGFDETFAPTKWTELSVQTGNYRSVMKSIPLKEDDTTRPQRVPQILFKNWELREDKRLFTIEVQTRRWATWELPETIRGEAQSTYTWQELQQAGGILPERILQMTNDAGEVLGEISIGVETELPALQPTFPEWRVRNY
ncbi:hypothetical protein P3T73_11275 [Kiritimatiellota bacterium B12222]|nr:hypothetical protein P3T73_11275 [Kiritimatiellota bacterium B12222]